MMRKAKQLNNGSGRTVIGISIVAGIVLGFFVALFHAYVSFSYAKQPYQSDDVLHTQLPVDQVVCEPSNDDKIGELHLIIEDLRQQLTLSEQSKEKDEKSVSSLHQRQKAGPFGTVKSIRTNPVVIPDESINPRLANQLNQVAVGKELIVALANANVVGMLQLWFANIKRVGIKNYLVVALDDVVVELCKSNDVPVYKRNPDEFVDAIAKDGNNHAISGLKFLILREFLQMGYSVLLSDIDVVFLRNPFDYLHRDCDVESMSDGHDINTAYGFNDVSDDPTMGWARYAHTMRIWVYNSGFFYIRPTIPSIELLDRVANRLAQDHHAWDQAVFNEELFFPSSPGYVGLHASRRTMDISLYMNSKVMFKTVRKDNNLLKAKPVVVHVNYHPDKFSRMKAIMEFYVNGTEKDLMSFPDGSA